MNKKIDYLTVCYINYDLIFLQIQNFKKRFDRNSYRFIVVDNTPPQYKNQELVDILKNSEFVDKVIEIVDSKVTTAIDRENGADESVSHGGALEEGLKYCDSEIVCIMDSDFFILDNDMNEYILDKFNQGYQAVGVSFDATSFHREIIDRNPSKYNNIPIIVGSFYKTEIAKTVRLGDSTKLSDTDGETGYRLRNYIADNKIKSMTWRMKHRAGKREAAQRISNENGKLVAVHLWAGSHRNNYKKKMDELRKIIENN